MGVKIIGTGSYLGQEVLSNEKLFSRVKNFDAARARETVEKKGNNVEGLSEEKIFDIWVKQVCGVEERPFFSEDQMTEENGPSQGTEYMGWVAAKEALKDAGIEAESIDHVIFGTFSPQQMMPNPACTAANYLGINGVSALHMNSACSSFLDALGLASIAIKAGQYKRVLVIAADHMSRVINFEDITTAILFGDGAAAAVLEYSDNDDDGVLSYVSMTNYSKEMLSMNTGEELQMKGGPLVQRNAVNAMHKSLTTALSKAGKEVADLDYLFPHQANLRIILRLADKLKIPYERTAQSVVYTGNNSGAAIGVAFDHGLKGIRSDMKIKKGDLLGLTTVGGGYTFSGLLYKV